MKTIAAFLVFFLPSLMFAQTMTEILGRPTNNAITINVLFDTQVNVYFEYGTTKGVYTNTTNTITSVIGEPVEMLFSNLQAATRYYYRTRYKKTTESVYQASPEHTFITQRQKGSTFRFTIESDPHSYDKKGNWDLWNICLANQLNDTADFMIDMGDTFGDDHTATTITSAEVQQLHLSCRNFLGKVCHSLPFFFSLGNHEGECGYYLLQTPPNNLGVYETLWRTKYYPNPQPNEFYTGCNTVEDFGMGKTENYYAWEWGDALFVVLDMYRYATKNEKPQKWDFTIGKQQYDWFKQTLENSTAKYKFVFSHHILGQGRGGIELAKSFEWGGYDAGTYKFDTYRPGWGLPLHQLMQANNVDIYFQGHDHIYVHQQLDGIEYQSVPMPSDSSYKIGITDNGDAYLSGTKLGGSGHLRVTVSPDSVQVAFVSAMLPKHETADLKNAQIRDVYTITKTGNTKVANNIVPITCTLFPNPTSEELYISLSQNTNSNLQISIINIDGKIVKQTNIYKPERIISLKLNDNSGNKLKSGIYLVKLTGDEKILMSKTVVLK